MERLKSILLVSVILACVAPAMAWDAGYGGDWLGFTPAWDNTSNWSGGQNEWLTEKWSVDPGDTSGGNAPMIIDGMDTVGGFARIRNGAVITQTGGAHQWFNGTGDSNPSVYMYNGAQWNISGGSLTINGTANLGYNGWAADGTASVEAINISGDGVVNLLKSEFETVVRYELNINNGSLITIADQGKLVVNTELMTAIDNLIASNKIVGIGGDLATATTGDLGEFYEVSVVPEPATMALLGLGAIAVFRRKQ